MIAVASDISFADAGVARDFLLQPKSRKRGENLASFSASAYMTESVRLIQLAGYSATKFLRLAA